MLFGAIWHLMLLILNLLLIPIFLFLPDKIIENFNDIATKIALKILWIIWCVIKLCFFIVLALVLMLITPVLIIWPPLCGAVWAWTEDVKIF